MDSLRVSVLGPVRAWYGESELVVGAPRHRAVLAVMAVQAGRVVSRDELVDALWGDDPPGSAANIVHTYVARLRRVLEPGRGPRAPGQVLVAAPPGYLLRLDPGRVDAALFARYLSQARESRLADRPDAAVVSLDHALMLWSGPPLAGVPGPFAEVERARLSEEYWTAVEDRAEALLVSGRAADVAVELAGRVRDQPLRERLRGLLMLALYRGGRQAEALAVFRDIRHLLAGELGIEPGPELQRLHQQILAADDALMPEQTSTVTGAAHRSRPARVIPAQLPHDAGDFTSRRAELGELIALAPPVSASAGTTDPGAVVISVIDGIAGVGKTALAVRAAHQAASRFPDGQLFLDLHGFTPDTTPMSPGEALGHLLRGLGADPQHIPPGIDDQSAMYRSMLAGRRVLIVLDNADSAGQVRPLLPGAGTCLVLITSRNRLDGLIARDGARRIALDVLTPGEATALLARISKAGQVAAEPSAAAELARLCGYLPLALRIAAERAAAHTSHTLADLAAELAAEHQRLDLLAVADDPTSVRAAFSSSCHALPAATARAFRLLGLHPGADITAPAAAALLGTIPSRARTVLEELGRRHLIEETGQGRYRFHDLIRVYAAEQAARQTRDQQTRAMRRLVQWYLHTADAADAIVDPRRPRVPLSPPGHALQPLRFSSNSQALHWCDAESGNLLAVTRHAANCGMHTLAWQLPTAMFGYFYLRKPWTTWLTATRIGLSAARCAGDPLGQAATHTSLGIAHGELCQPEAAICHLTQALALARTIGHRGGEAIALVTLGAAYRDLKRYDQAFISLRSALAIWRQAGDRWGQAIAFQYLGETYLSMGRARQAITNLQQALRIRRDIGDQYGAAWTRYDLAAAHCNLGDLGTAISHLHDALLTRQKIGDRWGEARTLALLGETLTAARRPGEARQNMLSAHAIFTELGDPEPLRS
jgi:DNA-binding SARP family transcriptional activator/tetratricopeptide (TPR) repeat protein